MDRLTGMDANGDIISTEEYTIIASKRITNEEKRSIENHILEKLYEYENMEEELKSLANLYEKHLIGVVMMKLQICLLTLYMQ